MNSVSGSVQPLRRNGQHRLFMPVNVQQRIDPRPDDGHLCCFREGQEPARVLQRHHRGRRCVTGHLPERRAVDHRGWDPPLPTFGLPTMGSKRQPDLQCGGSREGGSGGRRGLGGGVKRDEEAEHSQEILQVCMGVHNLADSGCGGRAGVDADALRRL